MANLTPIVSLNDDTVAPRYNSDTLSVVPHYDTYHDSDVLNYNIQELGYIENMISNNDSYDELKGNSDFISYTDYMLTIGNIEDNYVPPPIQKNDMMLSVIEQMKSQVEKCNKVKMDDPNITMEEYIRLEEEKARRLGKVFNWETGTYGKIWDNKDVHDLRSIFPAIALNDEVSSKTLSCEPTVSSLNDKIDFRVSFDDSNDDDYTVIFDKNSFSYRKISTNDLDFFKDFENNDAQTSKSDFLTKLILNPQNIDEFNLKDETSLSEYDEEEQNIICFNDLFPFNVIYPDELKLNTDNDNDKVDIEHSLEDLSVKPLPDLINTDVGAYAHGSNKLLETSHDTSNKFFKT
ncbi:hypothetical protein Tco_0450768, partial [Tanacetum coccineum]